ncbi:MAG: amino acid permease, partial [Clostridia bacterium]
KAFSIPSPQSGHITTYLGVDNGWFSALAPVAFCYESWWVTCALAKHSGNKHTNKAVVASNLIITAIYVLYFVGISSYGTSIAILGNNHLNSVVSDIFGNIFGKIIMAFVLIAMLGSVDTLVMGLIHMPDIMAGKGYVGGVFADSDDNLDNTSVFGAIFATISVSVWIVLHNLSEELEIFESSVSVGTDFAEIAMIASFSLLIVLYIKVIVQYKKGIITSVFAGIVCPVVAILITLLFVAGAIYNNALPFTICFAICALVFVAGYLYYNSKLKRKGEQGQSARIDEIVDKYIE